MKKSLILVAVVAFLGANTSFAAISSSLNVTGDTRIGRDVMVSASCGGVPTASVVSISLSQIETASHIGTAGTVGTNGDFFSTVRLPSTGFEEGPAFISATCPDGNTIMSAVILSADDGTVAGVSTVPVGGVAAGSDLDLALIFAAALIALGIIGLIWRGRDKLALK